MSKPYTAISDIGPNWDTTPLVTVVCSVAALEQFRPYTTPDNGAIIGEVVIGDSTGCMVLRISKQFEYIISETGPMILRNAIITIVHGRVMLETCACTVIDFVDKQLGICISPNPANNVSAIEYTLVSNTNGE